MTTRKSGETNLFEAAKAIYDTLFPLDEETRKRVLSSALSLLGIGAPTPLTTDTAQRQILTTSSAASSLRPMSPVELVQEKKPSTNAQRIAVFAYFREKFEGNSRFARADLKAYFSKARVPPPQNFDRDFIAAVGLGYIYEDGNDSYLTSKGLEAVEAGFDGKQPPRNASTPRGGPKKSKRSRPAKKR